MRQRESYLISFYHILSYKTLPFFLENGGFSEFAFIVNKPPELGACDVQPREGATLQDKFVVTCTDWVDDDEGNLGYKVGK